MVDQALKFCLYRPEFNQAASACRLIWFHVKVGRTWLFGAGVVGVSPNKEQDLLYTFVEVAYDKQIMWMQQRE